MAQVVLLSLVAEHVEENPKEWSGDNVSGMWDNKIPLLHDRRLGLPAPALVKDGVGYLDTVIGDDLQHLLRYFDQNYVNGTYSSIPVSCPRLAMRRRAKISHSALESSWRNDLR